jgi:hypothetical protein
MKVIEQLSMNDTEITILQEIFNNPVVKKYLHLLAHNTAIDVVNVMPNLEFKKEHIETWFIKQIYIKGQLSILDTLMNNIEPPAVEKPKE